MNLPKLWLFVAGPGDTGSEAAIVERSARALNAHYQRAEKFELKVFRYNGKGNPTSFGVRDDVQNKLDERLTTDNADIVIVVFNNQLGTRTNRNGRDYESYSAYELETALEASGLKKPLIGVFQFNPHTHAIEREYGQLQFLPREAADAKFKELLALSEQRRQIQDYLDRTRKKFGGLSAMKYADPEVFENQVNHFLADALISFSARSPDLEESQRPVVPRSDRDKFVGYPFRSLRSLGYEDHDLFHGRDAKVTELARRLTEPHMRFLCIAGPSGAGKSSLVKAGLIGGMIARRRRETDGSFWLIDMKPQSDPFMSLEAAVGAIARCSDGRTQTNSPIPTDYLRTLLKESCHRSQRDAELALERYLVQPLRSLSGDHEPEILLVIDQLEELWTRAEDRGENREAFLRLLAATVASGRMRVVTTLRSDLIPFLEEVRLVAEILGGGSGAIEHLTPPTIPAELEPMIRDTAKAGGIELEEALVGALLTDAEGVGPSALPLVAFTLSELVQRAAGRPVTFSAYYAIGRLPGAIENTVRSALERSLASTSERDLIMLFTRLVGVRDVTPEPVPVRELRRKTDLTAHGVSAALVEALIQARVLHVGGAGGDMVSLAHDALFQKWQPLKDWVAGNRIELAFRAALRRDAEEWSRHGAKRLRFVKLGPEALEDAQARVDDRPDLFRDEKLIEAYLRAAARRQDKVKFIGAINANSVGEAMDAWERQGGDLGLERYEDRGTDAGQLRPGIYASVTGQDGPDEAPATSVEAQAPTSKDGKDEAAAEQFAGGAREMQQRDDALRASIFQDPKNREVRVTRGRGPMHFAAMFGHLAIVRRLIALGESPRQKTDGGHAVLSDAAYGGHLETVRFLIEEVGADPKDPAADNSQAILWACQRGHEKVVDYLLSHGASFAMQVDEGWTCLTEAASGGHLHLVRRLIEQEDFDPDQATIHGITALMQAAGGKHARHLDVTRYLCEEAHVNRLAADVNNRSALHWASFAGTPKMVALLLDFGLDPNNCDSSGETPLHLSCMRGNLSVVRALLGSADVDLNISDSAGHTAIAHAALRGHDTIVQALVARGADPTKKEGTAWTALHHAAIDGDLAVIDALCDRNDQEIFNARVPPGWTAMMVAARNNQGAAIGRLRRAGASADLRDQRGYTALHIAADAGELDAVTAMLKAEATQLGDLVTFVDTPSLTGATALLLAAGAGHTAICRILLEAGADPNGRPKGDFRLTEAAASGDVEGCIRLLPQCHNPNVRDANGRTALLIAASAGNVELSRLLLLDRRVHVDARQWLRPDLAINDYTLDVSARGGATEGELPNV